MSTIAALHIANLAAHPDIYTEHVAALQDLSTAAGTDASVVVLVVYARRVVVLSANQRKNNFKRKHPLSLLINYDHRLIRKNPAEIATVFTMYFAISIRIKN